MSSERKPQYERVKCSDGFSMSVQASRSHYCNPRDNVGPWYSVEVGMPSHLDMLLRPYAEDPNEPTDTVYGWVPGVIVNSVIEAHGGLVSGELPPMVVCQTEINSVEE